MDIKKIVDVLEELRLASIQATPDTIKLVMKKYDMLFLGGKFNTIYSDELRHALKNHFNIEISNEDLVKVLPSIAKMLNMKLETMVAVEDVGKPNPRISYSIELW